jgi:ankyrin repeat protein
MNEAHSNKLLAAFDIEKGNNEQVKQLLSLVGIDARDGHLRTALIWATAHDNITLLSCSLTMAQLLIIKTVMASRLFILQDRIRAVIVLKY